MTARGSESLWGNNLGTFDDPERVQPQFVESKLSWFNTTDNLPRVEGNTLPHPDKRIA